MKQTIIVLGGSLLQRPLIDEAHALGFNVICSDRDPNCACRDICDTFWQIDTFDSAEHVRRAILLLEQGTQIKGLIAAGIDAIETAENVNGWIRTQTSNKHGFWAGYKATAICRNKHRFRAHQEKNEFEFPIAYTINTIQGALNTEYLEYLEVDSIIIKPVDNSGGRGNHKFSGEFLKEDWEDAVKYAFSQSKTGEIIIEELLIGKEYTVETIWEDGKMYPAFITDRYFRNDDKYAIEAGASHPTQLSKILQNKVYREMRRLGESLGMTYGPLKGDIMIVKTQKHRDIYETKIYIFEATTRYSGGFDCQYLVPMATGKNILKAAIQCNVYGKFDKDLLKAKWDKHSMVGSPFPKEGILKDIKLQGNINIEDKWFISATINSEIKYVDSTSRVAFLIVSRETRTETIRAMKEGLENIKIITE